jgi:hypothetical protein
MNASRLCIIAAALGALAVPAPAETLYSYAPQALTPDQDARIYSSDEATIFTPSEAKVLREVVVQPAIEPAPYYVEPAEAPSYYFVEPKPTLIVADQPVTVVETRTIVEPR